MQNFGRGFDDFDQKFRQIFAALSLIKKFFKGKKGGGPPLKKKGGRMEKTFPHFRKKFPFMKMKGARPVGSKRVCRVILQPFVAFLRGKRRVI